MHSSAPSGDIIVQQQLHVPSADPSLAEDLRCGVQVLQQAFLDEPLRVAATKTCLADDVERRLLVIRGGFALRYCALADGRRAIMDILLPGDIAGLDHVLGSKPLGEIVAASRLAYSALEPATLGKLRCDASVLLYLFAVATDARRRSDRLSAILGRLDAKGRIAGFILDVYDRLRRRGLVDEPTFELPVTQEQMGDLLGLTLVHVNRTCRAMREQALATIGHQRVCIQDMDGVRALVRGLPEPRANAPEVRLPRVRL